MIEYTGISEKGYGRKGINQDAILMRSSANRGLFAVADGMGGLSRGEEASQYIISELDKCWEETISTGIEEDLRQLTDKMKDVLQQCNAVLYSQKEYKGARGSTIVALLIIDNRYVLISSGDSRCYRIWKKWLGVGWQQLSVDDVWENNTDNVEGLTDVEIRNHRNFGRLTGAVGIADSFMPNVRTGATAGTELFMLMSDGIYKMADVKGLIAGNGKLLVQGKLEEGLNRIRSAVYDKGASDNLSLILVKP